MKKVFFAALLFFPLQLQMSVASDCRFESDAAVLEKSDSHLLQYWEFSGNTVTDSVSLPDSPVLAAYRKSVEAQFDTDPNQLLKRYSLTGPTPDDAFNLDVAMKSAPQSIRIIHCLEALLLDQQIKRTPQMLTEPTEFFALYLRNTIGQLRVYFLTDDMGGVRGMGSLKTAVTVDLHAGWSFVGNLHNHSFSLDSLGDSLGHDRKTYPQGVLAPSANDMKVFQAMKADMGLQSASITNGFNTIWISSDDFAKYHSAAD